MGTTNTKLTFIDVTKPDESVIPPFKTLFGTDIPSATNGSDGDFYFRHSNSTNAIYKKVSGNWVETSTSGGGGGGETDASNLGTGYGVFSTKTGNELLFKSLVAGPNIAISQTSSEITIQATSGGGSINSASNVGTGYQVFKEKVSDDLKFRTITAGTNITITQNDNDIVINSTGSGSSGETNLGANVGTGTGNVFRDKTGVTLNFKRLQAGSGVSITDNADEIILSASGEANTGTNLGTGHQVYASKIGTALQFKTLVAGSNILISSTGTEINISGPNPGEINTASNLGTGAQVFASKVGVDLRFRSITAGSNITITQNASDIVINSTASSASTTASNVGSGARVFKEKVLDDLRFRTLTAGSNITITENANDIVVNSTGEANTGTNLGTGAQVYASKLGTALQFKTLVAGSNITITETSTEITVSSASGSGEANTGANVGTGTGNVFRDKTGVTLNFKRLQAGSGISITDNANDITITATGGSVNSTLSNLTSPVAANQSISPGTQLTLDLGTLSRSWNNVYGSAIHSVHTTGQILGTYGQFSTISGGGSTTAVGIKTFLGYDLALFSDNDSGNSSGPSPSVFIATGNKTAGTGNSGSISLKTGTSVGGQRGSVILNGRTVDFVAATSGTLSMKPAATTTSHTLTWPSAQGASSTVLTNDGAGNLSWAVAASSGEANTASNLGSGQGIFSAKVGVDLRFKSLVAGTNITLASDANSITINSSASSGHITSVIYYDVGVAGKVIVKATGLHSDLDLLTATLAQDATSSTITFNRPTSVQFINIKFYLSASDTTGRTIMRVTMPDPSGDSTYPRLLRPLAYRMSATYGIAASTSNFTFAAGNFTVETTGHTSGAEQSMAVLG